MQQKQEQAKDTGNAAAGQQAFTDLHLASDTHRVGLGYAVQFTLSNGHFQAEWTPHVPTARDMRRVHAKYTVARDQVIAEIARQCGAQSTLCVELPT